jgi:anaphase-promoting complex subunit 2
VLDPAGVLLEAVAEPVKEYLRIRKDTVRCIVTSLTSDTNSELFEELDRSDLRELTGNTGDDSEEEAEAGDCARWKPDPIEADPTKTSQSRKTNDILSMLVTIYGSQELFVNEYRLMLADKLLANLDFNTDREVSS